MVAGNATVPGALPPGRRQAEPFPGTMRATREVLRPGDGQPEKVITYCRRLSPSRLAARSAPLCVSAAIGHAIGLAGMKPVIPLCRKVDYLDVDAAAVRTIQSTEEYLDCWRRKLAMPSPARRCSPRC